MCAELIHTPYRKGLQNLACGGEDGIKNSEGLPKAAGVAQPLHATS